MGTVGKLNEITGEFAVEWRIKEFLSLPAEVDICYESPVFSFAGISWHLRIYPNGRTDNLTSDGKIINSEGYTGLYLRRESLGPLINLEYSLGLKTLDEKINPERHLTYNFEKFPQFGNHLVISRSELLEKKSELVPSGVLTVVCKIKYSKTTEITSHTAFDKCSFCKMTFGAHEGFSSHQEKCMDKPIKCPECNDVVALKIWYEHKCRETKEEAGDCVERSSIVLHEKRVLQDFKEFYLKKEDCDVIIKMKGQEFPAHRAILQARSPVFASTYRHDTKEKTTGIIDIEDCEPSSFSDFLCFLYCGDRDIISVENVFSLFTTGDKYSVQDLRAQCVEFMKKNLSVETFCDTITLSVLHSETELITVATDFFTKHALEIAKTVKWQSFSANNPTQSNELFIKALAAKGSDG